ncbi:hypothetical protein [Maribellus maritimus]|nr:hypothetical protein [Maribellus maritimus]MCG6186126.1 hypothetical protein [Maribellus maritimus]
MGLIKKKLILTNMDNKISDSSIRLREMIEKAIEDHKITRDEYDKIIHIATEDGHIDRHEQALLSELQQMIEDKMVKFVMK